MVSTIEEQGTFKLSFKNYCFSNGDIILTSLIWDKISKEYVRMSKYMRKYCKRKIDSGRVVNYSFSSGEKKIERFTIGNPANHGAICTVIGSDCFVNMQMHLVSHNEMVTALELFKARVLVCTDPKCQFTKEELNGFSEELVDLCVSLSNCSNLYQIKMTVDTFYVYIPGTNHNDGAMVYLCTQ